MADNLPADSSIVRIVVPLLYPFMLLLGFYLIVNGQLTPGGGFQGGAIIGTVFLARYLVYPVEDINVDKMHLLERLFLAFVLLVPVLFLFSGMLHEYPGLRRAYLLAMDLLIGAEVGLGLGVVVFRFGFFQGVGKEWR
ncbi:MAG: MnhB domain-containing protein [Spirochaetia bacterium]